MTSMAWHSISLALVVIGTAAIMIGAAKTSRANGGWVQRALLRVPRRRNRGSLDLSMPNLEMRFDVTADGYVTPGYPGGGSAQVQIDWLRGELERQAARSNVNAVAATTAVNAERQERVSAASAIGTRVDGLEVAVEAGLRRTALDGLVWAVSGAVLIGVGDVIGAIVTLGA